LGIAGVAFAAPQARLGTWYPRSFLAPFEENQPWLDSALERVGAVVAEIEAAGVPAERVVIFGFSQGACLASEFVARRPRRYGALVAATGGRIDLPGTDFAVAGDLAARRVHLSAGDPGSARAVDPRRGDRRQLRGRGRPGHDVHREAGFHAVHPEAVAFARRGVVAPAPEARSGAARTSRPPQVAPAEQAVGVLLQRSPISPR
jgi:phospholipase/carboxylesterase